MESLPQLKKLFSQPPTKAYRVFITGYTPEHLRQIKEMSKEQQRPLQIVHLSSVVSKYIGETEKSLTTVFRQAAKSGAVLLFDEADALFGKRTEVKDAHDRYANQEVSYLLQQMAKHKGMVLLAISGGKETIEALRRHFDLVV